MLKKLVALVSAVFIAIVFSMPTGFPLVMAEEASDAPVDTSEPISASAAPTADTDFLLETDTLTATDAANAASVAPSENADAAPETASVDIIQAEAAEESISAGTFTVTFNANGGTGVMDTITMANGDSLPANTIIRTGYALTGWNTAVNGGGTAYADRSTITGISSGTAITLYAQWRIITYSLTYDLNGGRMEGADMLPMQYDVNTSTFAIPQPRLIGHTFLGWSGSNMDGMVQSLKITQGSTGDRSYTANWSANSYTLTFDANGGQGTVEAVQATYGEMFPSIHNQMYRDGFRFNGFWLTPSDTMNNLIHLTSPSQFRVSHQSATGLTMPEDGVFQLANSQRGRDDSNSGETYVQYFTDVIEPDKTYTYSLMYKTSANTHSVDIYCHAGNSYIYTARFPASSEWSQAVLHFHNEAPTNMKFSVRFDNNGSTDGKISYLWVKNIALAEGSSEIKEVYDDNNQPLIEYAYPYDLTLYAHWLPNNYTVSFDANGGTGTMTTINMVYNEETTLPANTFTRDGYDFAGWALTPDGDAEYADQASVMNLLTHSDGNVMLYAVWSVKQYFIHLNCAIDGTATTSLLDPLTGNPAVSVEATFDNVQEDISGKHPYGTAYSIKVTPRSGYAFGDGTTSKKEWSGALTGDLNLQVPLERIPYTITYALDGGTNDASNHSTYTVAQTITFADPNRDGYQFAGWSASGSFVTGIPQGTTGNIELTAHWAENPHLPATGGLGIQHVAAIAIISWIIGKLVRSVGEKAF